MRIAICSVQCNGKTTLINAIKEKWPMYKTLDYTYRDEIRENKIPVNLQTTRESQRLIRDALFMQDTVTKSQKYIITDRCILDNIVYSMRLLENSPEEDGDVDFISESIFLCREAIKNYDVIFWLPWNDMIDRTDSEREMRELDGIFVKEIESLYKSVYNSYVSGQCILVDPDEHPPIIKLSSRTVDGKIEEIARIIDDKGNLRGTSGVLDNIEEAYKSHTLLQEFGLVKEDNTDK